MNGPSVPKLARWGVVAPAHAELLPPCFLTAAPSLPVDHVPPEVGLLLPTGTGPHDIASAFASAPEADEARSTGCGVGLFMASPFLAVDRDAARLQEAGCRWVANLPSTHQQDMEFRQQLEDVHLDWAREVDCLGRFRALGMKCLAVLCDETVCTQVLAAQPDAVVILPRVADFAAGFPSMLRRGGPAQTVSSSLRAEGWDGPVLVLGSDAEAASPTLWPPGVDGLLLRPVTVT